MDPSRTMRDSPRDLSFTGSYNMSVSEQFHMVPLKMDDSFGLDLSLGQAVERLLDLMKENHNLKETLKENNLMLKSSQTLLLQMKTKWEAEQLHVSEKFLQAKSVVLSLRRETDSKKYRIDALEQQLREPGVKRDQTSGQQTKPLSSDLHKREIDNLKIQIDMLQKRATDAVSQRKTQEEKSQQLEEDLEERESQMSIIVQQNKKILECNKQLERENSRLKSVDDMSVSAGKLSAMRITDSTDGSLTNDDKVKEELEAEKRKVQSLVTQLDSLKNLQSTTHQELEQLRVTMVGRVREIESIHIQKEEQLIHQLDTLHRQLQHQSVSSQGMESIDTLRAQVLSLLNEVTQSNTKQQQIHAVAENYRLKFDEVERKFVASQEELLSLRSRDDQMIQTLRSTIAETERALAKQKKKNDELSSMVEEYHQRILDLQKSATSYKQQLDALKRSGSSSPGVSGSLSPGISSDRERRELQETVDRLTAQLITTEDTLLEKQQEIQAHQEKVLKMRKEQENVPYLKSQRDSYKADFETESRGRHIDRQKINELKGELETMRLFSKQLQDQLAHQNRYPPASQSSQRVPQYRSQHSQHSQHSHMRSQPYPGGGYDECDARAQGQKSPDLDTQHSAEERENSTTSHKESTESHDDTDTDTLTEYRCPRCGLATQDIDSLTIHAEECLTQTQC